MQTCLGIYVQDNIIKYSKVSRDRDVLKIEAYGVKFHDGDIEKTIEQIVKETYSYQVPISINIEKEQYTYSNVFKLLKPQDLEKAIETEFEFFCNNNNKNKNTLEFRKIKTQSIEDKDKIRVVYSYIDKAKLAERLQITNKYKMQNISPMAVTIPNLNKIAIQDNCIIVNLEEKTEITTILNGKIYKADKIEKGMKDIFNTIAERENSIQRAYEICKNTTVYTKTGQNLKIEGNEYLDDIITYLIEIIERVRENIDSLDREIKIENIYLTGMGVIINNIDLLFQENFIDKKCEILIPSFIEKTNVKINIKDYIEVNSATSLALQGIDKNKEQINFAEQKMTLQKMGNTIVTKFGIGNNQSGTKIKFKEVMTQKMDTIDKSLLRLAGMCILVIALYVTTTEVLSNQINEKIKQADTRIEKNRGEIAKIDKKKTLIDSRTSEYMKVVNTINETNSQISENYLSKNAVPNLLNKIMYNIPVGVQIISIENQTDKDITIVAQAEKYEQLGYFKAVLEEEGILTDITTTRGAKQNNVISITITGKLPY